MSPQPASIGPEEQKLITLARSARARTGADQAAAVRDTDGRTYVAASVRLAALSLSALQVAVAMAVSSGALGLEAAVILGDDPADEAGSAAVREVAPAVAIWQVDAAGSPIS